MLIHDHYYYCYHAYYMLGTLSTFYCLIFITTLWRKYNYYCHFIGEDTEDLEDCLIFPTSLLSYRACVWTQISYRLYFSYETNVHVSINRTKFLFMIWKHALLLGSIYIYLYIICVGFFLFFVFTQVKSTSCLQVE